MRRFSATRGDLRVCEAQMALARLGRELLENKREQLLREFRLTAEVVLARAGDLERAAVAARTALTTAVAADGPEAVASAGLATEATIAVETRNTTVMGVDLPEVVFRPIGRALLDRGYALTGASPHVDEAATRFEAELEIALQSAVSETRARRLANEIGRTTRRVNGLERVLLPRLEADRDAIKLVLEERDRYDRFRLKKVKARRTASEKGF